MAIDLKRKGFAQEVLGVEAEPVNAAAAEKIGLVDRGVSFSECLEQCDLVGLAVPVGAAVRMLPQILDGFRAIEEKEGSCTKVVIDVCSTKEHLARSVKYHPDRCSYVATHPMAGTEYSGPWAAMPGRPCLQHLRQRGIFSEGGKARRTDVCRPEHEDHIHELFKS